MSPDLGSSQGCVRLAMPDAQRSGHLITGGDDDATILCLVRKVQRRFQRTIEREILWRPNKVNFLPHASSLSECERRKKAEPSGSRLVSLPVNLGRTRTFMRASTLLPVTKPHWRKRAPMVCRHLR
jgi:hypothetical protein